MEVDWSWVSCKNKEYVNHTDVKMYFVTKQFTTLKCCVPLAKPHGLWGLIKNNHLWLDPKLGHGICEIHQKPSACVSCTTMSDNKWSPGVSRTENPYCQHVLYYKNWPMLGTYNNWNIINLTNEYISIEYFDDIQNVFLDLINQHNISNINVLLCCKFYLKIHYRKKKPHMERHLNQPNLQSRLNI